MTPYYQDDLVTLYHGDCRDVLPVDGDAVITDPPYGIGEHYHSYDDSRENLIQLIADVWPLISHHKRIALTSGNRNQHLWPAPTWRLAWFVPAGVGVNPWGFTCWQPILVYGADPYLEVGAGSRPDAFTWTEASFKSEHPCEKPEGLWRWVVTRCSASTDVLIDPFAGAGTTLVVAKRIGQRAIGIEREERYCEIAAKRLSQGSLSAMFT